MADEEDCDYGEDYGPDEDEGSSGREKKGMKNKDKIILLGFLIWIIVPFIYLVPKDALSVGILVILAVLYFLSQYLYFKLWQRTSVPEVRETSRWKVDDNGGMTLTGRSYRRMDYDGGYIYDQRDDDHKEGDEDHPSYIS